VIEFTTEKIDRRTGRGRWPGSGPSKLTASQNRDLVLLLRELESACKNSAGRFDGKSIRQAWKWILAKRVKVEAKL